MNRSAWLAKPSEAEFVLLALCVSMLSFFLFVVAIGGFREFDFLAYRAAGHDVLHGHSPYPPATEQALWRATKLVYPPIVAYAFVPFALVPVWLGGVVLAAILIGAMLATFRVLDIRDRRCYAVPFLAYPLGTAIGNGAFGPLLALGLALAWKHRDRTRVVAPVLALVIVVKLFLWPVGFWLLATRRFTSLAWTMGLTAAFFLLPFLPLGLGTLRHYLQVLRVLDKTYGQVSYTPHALIRELGGSPATATLGVVVIAVLLAILALMLARAGREDATFATTVAAALLLTPISWPHYYVLLYTPLAVCRPRLSLAWFAFLGFYILPSLNTAGDPWRVAIGIAIIASVLGACIRGERSRIAWRIPGRSAVVSTPQPATIEPWTS